jgi:thiamine biosynthesis protein ThiS
MSQQIVIRVNGVEHSVPKQSSIAAVLALLNRTGLVAVERNKVLVPRAQHNVVMLAEHDELEIVSFVGGG